MSSCPGLDLEDYLLWEHNLVCSGFPEANVSIGIATFLGLVKDHRQVVTEEQFQELVAIFESEREATEYWLLCFDDDNQSWRNYASYSEDRFPKEMWAAGKALLKKFAEEGKTDEQPKT